MSCDYEAKVKIFPEDKKCKYATSLHMRSEGAHADSRTVLVLSKPYPTKKAGKYFRLFNKPKQSNLWKLLLALFLVQLEPPGLEQLLGFFQQSLRFHNSTPSNTYCKTLRVNQQL